MKTIIPNLTAKRAIIIAILLLVVMVSISAFTAYCVARSQINIRFISQPKKENENYGYLEIKGKEYYQLYTTTQVDIGNGLHYHRLDLRSSDIPKTEELE